ncbi:MAG TPA: hypothetical protein VG498_25470, partial [Terriglobales bacterium]|nr:hypothetical protein [Terriglobales bacterium]
IAPNRLWSARINLKMACKIERFVIREDLVMLCISGHVTGQEVDALRAVLEQETSAVVIDLKHVLLVDREAVKLLASRESNGTELKNCPAYIREWVSRESAEMRAGSPESGTKAQPRAGSAKGKMSKRRNMKPTIAKNVEGKIL